MHEKRHFLSYRKRSHDALHHSGGSLQNGQLKLWRRNRYFAQKTYMDTAVSVWACEAGFWKSTSIHGVCEIALTEVLATQMGVMRRSNKVRSFELYKFNPLSPHCGLIAWELMHCYTCGHLRIVTVRGNTEGRHGQLFCRPHAYTVYWRI